MDLSRSLRLFFLPATTIYLARSLDQSLTHCKEVASAFRNTCNHDGWSTPAESVEGMEYEDFQCSARHAWERKLCVTCREDGGVTKIRIQTNNMPDHCVNQVGQLEPQNFDYEVEFNRLESQDELLKNFRSQNQVDQAVCSIRKNYDSDLAMDVYGDDHGEPWGYSLNGVIFQMANEFKEDPVFPITESFEQPLDQCLGHIQRNGEHGMYHYHHMSPCINSEFITQKQLEEVIECEEDSGPDGCSEDITAWVLSGHVNMTNSKVVDGRTIIGVSTDGHVLYGPYQQTGELWNANEVDLCNGAWDSSGDYFYVATQWHPYVSGCQGPANSGVDAGFFPNCSTNGMEKYNAAATTATTTTTITTITTTITTTTTTTLSPTSVLLPGDRLESGEMLTADGNVKLTMQSSGNLRLSMNGLIWASYTQRNVGAHLEFQSSDGNLVIYNEDGASVWSSGPQSNAAKVVLQSDCNLVTYDANGNELWSLGTSCDRRLDSGAHDLKFSAVSVLWIFYGTVSVAWPVFL